MKSVNHNSKNNEKCHNFKILKQSYKNDKSTQKVNVRSETTLEDLQHRPSSCPMNSSWAPSRNWHKYLSGQQVTNKPSSSKNSAFYSNNKSEDPLTKPDDALISIKLPKVNFCSPRKEEPPAERPLSFDDLCDEDKHKIALLVEEIARCKQQKEEDEDTIFRFKNKITDLKSTLKKLHAEKQEDNKSISLLKSLHENEQIALKKQLSELNQLLYEMQVQKTTSDVQLRTISSQAERMTKAIHAMHRENTELQVELRLAKERLGLAQQAVEKMTNDLKNVQDHIRPSTEDKACQSAEDILSKKVHVKKINNNENLSEDQKILTELFFNKSVQNTFSPQETIIFLSADYKESFTTF